MRSFNSSKAAFLFPLAALTAAAISPAQANYFHQPNTKMQRNVGSAPNPTVYDMSGVYPTASLSTASEQKQVALKISLSETGAVSSAAVEHSSGIARLDDAAVKYVETSWSYEPIKAQQMPSEMLLTVDFVQR